LWRRKQPSESKIGSLVKVDSEGRRIGVGDGNRIPL
jgi:hypothetical protein